jgi:hypothetical protein
MQSLSDAFASVSRPFRTVPKSIMMAFPSGGGELLTVATSNTGGACPRKTVQAQSASGRSVRANILIT